MDSPAAVAARMSLKRDHREVCTSKASDNISSPQELRTTTTATTIDITTARRETCDCQPTTHEASHSVLARLFADAQPPSSPLSRLTVDPLESPRKEHSSDTGAPMSWPRAYSRYTSSSNQTPPPMRIHTHQNIFETSPTGAPRSASSDFRQQLQEHQQQRFLLKRTTHTQQQQHQQQAAEAEAEPQDEVSMLREQVALLLKNLDAEKKRRMLEQKLMQEKIIELQGLIRRDYPEQQRAQERRLVQMRSPNASRSKLLRSTSKHSVKAQLSLSRKSSKSSDVSAASEEGDENNQSGLHQQRDNNNSNSSGDLRAASSPAGKALKEDAKVVEARMKKQLTKLRARMQAMVTDAQLETQSLRLQLQNEKQIADRKERQLRVEMNAKMFAFEERHSTTKKRLSEKVALLSLHVKQLLTENDMLADQLKEKDARISHLELAVGGKLIMENAFPNHHQRQQ